VFLFFSPLNPNGYRFNITLYAFLRNPVRKKKRFPAENVIICLVYRKTEIYNNPVRKIIFETLPPNSDSRF
jgi:hypothetical protein